MNRPIVRLYGLVIVLFGLLVAFTSRWTVFEAQALRDNPDNRRQVLAEQKIRRGTIRTADGEVIARSRRGEGGVYSRRYALGALFGHPVGYSYTSIGRSGLEQSANEALTGSSDELVTVFESLMGRRREGSDIITTLDSRAQRVAMDALDGRKGAVVAIEADTGAVRTMASSPGFDPNGLDDRATFRALAGDDEARRLVNRTTLDTFPPGSTFKVVTAAAALDSGRYQPSSPVQGPARKVVSGVELQNFNQQDFGTIDLTTALTKSVNTVWAEVGVSLGRNTMQEYMERFGFYEKPELDYPDGQMLASGVRKRRGPVPVTSGSVDLGRVAIGQGDLQVTPMQMAIVAATVANGGRRMKPRLVQRIVDPDGRTAERASPDVSERVMSRDAAQKLAVMMRSVVREGTGTAAALTGVEVAGKTGTAEINIEQRINDPWFIGFAGDTAVAVVLDRVPQGTGGEVAAPIAKQVLQALGER
ncbi:MAG: penicillin-binding transpeptidase domain-containing protein [Actinomycetota bacterium]|nr:penicillin-binding transpeptidase domain-containing protein [Actinomycetota bacterium]